MIFSFFTIGLFPFVLGFSSSYQDNNFKVKDPPFIHSYFFCKPETMIGRKKMVKIEEIRINSGILMLPPARISREDILEELIEAILNNNLERVKGLLNDPGMVNLNQKGGEKMATPLFYAVEAGNLEIARLLIDKGSDVNVFEYQIAYESCAHPLIVATYNHDVAMADLLLSKGANPDAVCDDLEGTTPRYVARKTKEEKILQLFAKYTNPTDEPAANTPLTVGVIEEYIRAGKFALLDSLIFEGKLQLHDQLNVLYHYTYGPAGFQELVRKYGPKEIAAGTENLLDQFLSTPVYGWTRAEEDSEQKQLKFPVATTFLYNKNQPFRYSPDKAFDGDLVTSWVEGVKDHGTGQKLAFVIPDNVKTLSILPGFGSEKSFLKNNRVKSASLTIYLHFRNPTPFSVEEGFYIDSPVYSGKIGFKDEMTFQDVLISLPARSSIPKASCDYVAVLEILEIYPGTDWNDTCIAEINVK